MVSPWSSRMYTMLLSLPCDCTFTTGLPPWRRRARAEFDIHHGVLGELHLASPSDHIRIHGPRQSVVPKGQPHVLRALRRRRTQQSESHAATPRPASDVGVCS